jgi:hypothetical protein
LSGQAGVHAMVTSHFLSPRVRVRLGEDSESSSSESCQRCLSQLRLPSKSYPSITLYFVSSACPPSRIRLFRQQRRTGPGRARVSTPFWVPRVGGGATQDTLCRDQRMYVCMYVCMYTYILREGGATRASCFKSAGFGRFQSRRLRVPASPTRAGAARRAHVSPIQVPGLTRACGGAALKAGSVRLAKERIMSLSTA